MGCISLKFLFFTKCLNIPNLKTIKDTLLKFGSVYKKQTQYSVPMC